MGYQGRILIVGFGVRGRQWADATALGGHKLVGIVETDQAVRFEAQVPTFAALERALDALQPDLVVLATPPAVHVKQAHLALQRNVAVLSEKPLSETVREAAELVLEAKRRNGVVLVGMNFRFLPVTIRLRRLVAAQSLGNPLFSRFGYIRNRDGRRSDLNSFPLTMDQPMLMEQSVHHIDAMRFVLGREVIAVRAHTWNPSTSVYRDDSCVAALVEFEGGVVVEYTGTWTSGSNRLGFEWRIDFERGVALQTRQFSGLSVSTLDRSAALAGPIFDSAAEPRRRLRIRPAEPFRTDTAGLLEHAIRVVRGIEPPGPTAADHLRTLLVLDAVAEASRLGNRVVIRDLARDRGVLDAMT